MVTLATATISDSGSRLPDAALLPLIPLFTTAMPSALSAIHASAQHAGRGCTSKRSHRSLTASSLKPILVVVAPPDASAAHRLHLWRACVDLPVAVKTQGHSGQDTELTCNRAILRSLQDSCPGKKLLHGLEFDPGLRTSSRLKKAGALNLGASPKQTNPQHASDAGTSSSQGIAHLV